MWGQPVFPSEHLSVHKISGLIDGWWAPKEKLSRPF